MKRYLTLLLLGLINTHSLPAQRPASPTQATTTASEFKKTFQQARAFYGQLLQVNRALTLPEKILERITQVLANPQNPRFKKFSAPQHYELLKKAQAKVGSFQSGLRSLLSGAEKSSTQAVRLATSTVQKQATAQHQALTTQAINQVKKRIANYKQTINAATQGLTKLASLQNQTLKTTTQIVIPSQTQQTSQQVQTMTANQPEQVQAQQTNQKTTTPSFSDADISRAMKHIAMLIKNIDTFYKKIPRELNVKAHHKKLASVQKSVIKIRTIPYQTYNQFLYGLRARAGWGRIISAYEQLKGKAYAPAAGGHKPEVRQAITQIDNIVQRIKKGTEQYSAKLETILARLRGASSKTGVTLNEKSGVITSGLFVSLKNKLHKIEQAKPSHKAVASVAIKGMSVPAQFTGTGLESLVKSGFRINGFMIALNQGLNAATQLYKKISTLPQAHKQIVAYVGKINTALQGIKKQAAKINTAGQKLITTTTTAIGQTKTMVVGDNTRTMKLETMLAQVTQYQKLITEEVEATVKNIAALEKMIKTFS